MENTFHWKVWTHVSDECLKVFSFWSSQRENPNYYRRVGVQTYFHKRPLFVQDHTSSSHLLSPWLPAVSMPLSVRPVIVTWTLEFALLRDSETETRDPECIQCDMYSFYASWVKKIENICLHTRTPGKPFSSNSFCSLSKCSTWNLLNIKLSTRNIPSILATITSLFTCYWNVKVNSLLRWTTHRQAFPIGASFRITMYRIVLVE